MNRAEFRRQQKEKAKSGKTLMLTQSERDKIKEEATSIAVGRAFTLLLGMCTYSLRAEFNFGEKRLTKFIDRVMSAYDAYTAGNLSLDDMHIIVYQETGITLQDENGNDIISDKEKHKKIANKRENDHISRVMNSLIEAEEAD